MYTVFVFLLVSLESDKITVRIQLLNKTVGSTRHSYNLDFSPLYSYFSDTQFSYFSYEQDLLSLTNSVNEVVLFNANTRLVQLVTRRFDSRFSKIKPKLRPSLSLLKKLRKAWTHKTRIVIGLAIFAAWFTYIGSDLIKTGYKYFQKYQSNQIMPDQPSVGLGNLNCHSPEDPRKKENDSDNEI